MDREGNRRENVDTNDDAKLYSKFIYWMGLRRAGVRAFHGQNRKKESHAKAQGAKAFLASSVPLREIALSVRKDLL
jgi:hypothetical protein